jgi:hypothetical protein
MTPTAEELKFLQSIDTPTVCNLIEIVAPQRRGAFYTVKHLHCPFPDLPPMVGFAKTVTIRVQSNVHKALGCLGTVTNGSIRDIPQIPPGFQMLAGSIGPSHAYVHVIELGCEVNIHGMTARSGDLIHADRHGAVVVPADKITSMKAALDGLAGREARIIAAARAAGATAETIKAAMKG